MIKRDVLLNGIKAVIFDLDGTLIDSMHIWLNIDIEFLKRKGFAVSEKYTERVASLSLREAAEYTIKAFNLNNTAAEIIDEWNEMALAQYSESIFLKPYSLEFLRYLKANNIRMCIATSLSKKLCFPALKNNNIEEFFEFVCFSEDIGKGKTSPDIFYRAIDKLLLSPSECLVFDDILPAVKSARSTGARVCGVYDASSLKDKQSIIENADYYIHSFNDIFIDQG